MSCEAWIIHALGHTTLVSSDLSVRSSSGSSDTSVPSVGRLTFRPRHGTLSTPSSGHSTFFEIRQLDLSLAHLGHLPGARHLLDVRAGPLGPEAPTQQGADRPLLGGPRGHRAPGRNRRRDPTDTAPANPRSLSENPIWVAAGVAPAGLVALTRCIPLMRANVPFAFPCAPCDPSRRTRVAGPESRARHPKTLLRCVAMGAERQALRACAS